MRIAIYILVLITVFSCKSENKHSSLQADNMEASSIQSSENDLLDKALLQQKISGFYYTINSIKGPGYKINKLNILNIKTVEAQYVDSIKRELYLGGLTKIADNISVRQEMINSLKKKAARYKAQGKTDKIEEVDKTIEKYELRNEIQREESDDLSKRDSIIRMRMLEVDSTTTEFYEVMFYLEEVVNQILRQDTSSLIFREAYQIEDLLNDRAWEAQ